MRCVCTRTGLLARISLAQCKGMVVVDQPDVNADGLDINSSGSTYTQAVACLMYVCSVCMYAYQGE